MLHGSDRGARFTLIEKVANSSWRTERLVVLMARTIPLIAIWFEFEHSIFQTVCVPVGGLPRRCLVRSALTTISQ